MAEIHVMALVTKETLGWGGKQTDPRLIERAMIVSTIAPKDETPKVWIYEGPS